MANLAVLKEVEKRLAKRYQRTQTAFADDTIATAVHGLVECVEDIPVLKDLAEALFALEDGPTVAEWREASKSGWLCPPVERNRKARLCYEFFLDWYSKKDNEKFDFSMAIVDVGHRMSPSSRKYDECARVFVDSFVDPFYEYLDEELAALIADEEVKDEDVAEPNPENKNKVFVVHGRDTETLATVLDYLKVNGLDPLTFDDARMLVGTASPNILQVVDKGMQESCAVVVLITPDDVARLHDEPEELLRKQARLNVVFEAGIAFGRYRKRTVLVEYDEPSMFSDLHGYYVVRLKKGDGGIEGLDNLRKQLKVAGCELD